MLTNRKQTRNTWDKIVNYVVESGDKDITFSGTDLNNFEYNDNSRNNLTKLYNNGFLQIDYEKSTNNHRKYKVSKIISIEQLNEKTFNQIKNYIKNTERNELDERYKKWI